MVSNMLLFMGREIISKTRLKHILFTFGLLKTVVKQIQSNGMCIISGFYYTCILSEIPTFPLAG